MADEIDVLRALAHPVRWGILERLAAEPGICACSFTEYFDVSQPTISAHLKALRQAGLVTTQRRGTEIWYSLARDQLAPLAGRLSGIASPGAPVAQAQAAQAEVAQAPEVQAPAVPATAVPATVVPATTSAAGDGAVRRRPPGRAAGPVPAVDARSPGRLADVVAAGRGGPHTRRPGRPPPLAAAGLGRPRGRGGRGPGRRSGRAPVQRGRRRCRPASGAAAVPGSRRHGGHGPGRGASGSRAPRPDRGPATG